MNESVFDEEEQRIQRILNQLKRKELEEKYDATFSESDPDIPPDVESEWLNYIEEFERQARDARKIPLREFLGNPHFRPLGEIPVNQLEMELDRVRELFALHNVEVDCLDEVSHEELYRFMTTELLEEEIEDIRIDGMKLCYIYEEFHPNDAYDATMFAEYFLWDIFERQGQLAIDAFARDEVYDPSGKKCDMNTIKSMVHSFFQKYPLFTGYKFNCIGCSLEGDYATVRYETEWSGLQKETMESLDHNGVSVLRMKKGPYGGFEVVQMNIPGFGGGQEDRIARIS